MIFVNSTNGVVVEYSKQNVRTSISVCTRKYVPTVPGMIMKKKKTNKKNELKKEKKKNYVMLINGIADIDRENTSTGIDTGVQ